MNPQTQPRRSPPPPRTASRAARRLVKICNQKGLHARAAARFVKTASQFDAEVTVRKNGTAVSGRSIMGLMMLAAASGTVVEARRDRAGRRRRRRGARASDRMQV